MRTKIIAELSWCHMGDISLAKEMSSAAIECGADFVKFQTWSVKNLKKGDWDNDGRREIYSKAELKRDDYEELHDYVESLGAQFLTSVFFHEDIDKLPNYYNDFIKIPSTEIANKPLITKALERFTYLIISTGASTEQEILSTYNMCKGRCTLMHCVSIYPCSYEFANLTRIHWLKEISPSMGYSDHTFGVSAPAYAIAHGCDFLEKHFTTDSTLPGRDNKFAATPDIFSQICKIRDEIGVMTYPLGTGYQDGEQGTRDLYRGRWSGERGVK